MEHAHELAEELRPKSRALRDAIGGVYSAYAEMSRAAMTDGALSGRIKELVALAIAATRPRRVQGGSHRQRGSRGNGRGDHDERWSRHGVGAQGLRRVRGVRGRRTRGACRPLSP